MNYRKSVTFTQARQLIADWSAEQPLREETIALEQATSRLMVDDVITETGSPTVDCCAVDGYAVRFSILKQSETGVLQFNPTCSENNAARVCYGEVLPDFADTVVALEQVNGDGNDILTIIDELHKGDNVCYRHSDLKPKQKIIKSNQRITAQHLGLLASVNYSKITVRQMPKVVLLSITIRQDAQPAEQRYDPNLEILKSLLSNMGCRVLLAKAIANNPGHLQSIFDKLRVKDLDFIVVTGFLNSGDNKQMLNLLSKNGQIAFSQVRVQPSSSVVFGRLGRSLLFGLPKAPVAAFTALCQFVWPAIKKVVGEADDDLLWRGKITHDLEKKHFHREFVRAFFMQTVDGGLEVTMCDGQQPSRIKSLTEANCFMILDESNQSIRAGEVVRIQPFYQFSARTV